MLYHLPDQEALFQILTSRHLPSKEAASAVRAGREEDGSLLIETTGKLSTSVLKALQPLGLTKLHGRSKRKSVIDQDFSCWYELLKPVPSPAWKQSHNSDNSQIVQKILFQLSSEEQLREVSSEMFRLGNDQQRFQVLQSDEDSEDFSCLLLVINPPWYSLLRAMAGWDEEGSIDAYWEQAPHIWVELGFEHPLLRKVKLQPKSEQMLLIHSSREWRFVLRGPYQDLYELLEVQLPDQPTLELRPEPPEKLIVPLKLKLGSDRSETELWVLFENARDQLNAFIESASEEVIARLQFAVVTPTNSSSQQSSSKTTSDSETILLRLRPGPGTPPVLPISALECHAYMQLSQLFVPVGHYFFPPVRRQTIHDLISSEQDSMIWLHPLENGEFAIRSVDATAFRSLSEWVEYILHTAEEHLQTWKEGMTFAFESFICHEGQNPNAPPDPGKLSVARKHPDQSTEREQGNRLKEAVSDSEQESGLDVSLNPQMKADEWITPLPLNELQVRVETLEETCWNYLSELDDISVVSQKELDLWAELASLYLQLGHRMDGSNCWMNRIWRPGQFAFKDISIWAEAETQLSTESRHTLSSLLSLLEKGSLARATGTLLLSLLSRQIAKGEKLQDILPYREHLKDWLESQEQQLPWRLVWMGWRVYFCISNEDVLTLARARDRILNQLHDFGLVPERELPSFLRFSRSDSGTQDLSVVIHLKKLHQELKSWAINEKNQEWGRSGAYLDLIFAYGFAKLNHIDLASKFQEEALVALKPAIAEASETYDATHVLISKAYRLRIQEALEGKLIKAAFSAELLQIMEQFRDDHDAKEIQQAFYRFEKLRKESLLIDPFERIKPYRQVITAASELQTRLDRMYDIAEPEQLAQELKQLLLQECPLLALEGQGALLRTCLELAPRLNVDVGELVLQELRTFLNQDLELSPLLFSRLLDKGLQVSLHFGQSLFAEELVGKLEGLLTSTSFQHLLQAMLTWTGSSTTNQTTHQTQREFDLALEELIRHSLTVLKKLGLRNEMLRMLNLLASIVKKLHPPQNSTQYLKVMCWIAGGWFVFGRDTESWTILDQARERLIVPYGSEYMGRADILRVPLLTAYIQTLGEAPIQTAMEHLHGLFVPDPNDSSSPLGLPSLEEQTLVRSHYSLSHLQIAETIVLTLSTETFSLDNTAREWLDECEFRLRQQIHRDVQSAVNDGTIG